MRGSCCGGEWKEDLRPHLNSHSDSPSIENNGVFAWVSNYRVDPFPYKARVFGCPRYGCLSLAFHVRFILLIPHHAILSSEISQGLQSIGREDPNRMLAHERTDTGIPSFFLIFNLMVFLGNQRS